ncbi:lysine N(6)-hydroxylase/L-ornithine N(5)-oxygenase family protein [Streptomyces sp. NPDC001852]|uniref:lysine N(6)-hydroxylase/L-ornithine N(5)-oxygenase family protein n=1 Tax=Streptomyces sp. NPDC001852 TaxID=3364619 RepID=UPI0036A0C7DA
MQHDPQNEPPLHDVVGIGFGPSNLALAIAIEEYNESVPRHEALTAAFVERKPEFGWHRGMLIPGATMQVSFLKDLATLRNPTSRFGFLPYLHDRGRLVDFTNHKVFFPTREEFHDYLEWAATGVDHMVRYGLEVTEIRPVESRGTVPVLEVVARAVDGSGEIVLHRARNIVLATGLRPRLPAGIESSARQWHSGEFLSRLAELGDTAPERFVVVGAGQSGAEIVDHLHRTHPQAEVHAVISRYGYSPADDSPYANRIFDPQAVDVYYAADEAVKRRLMDYHRNTNYGVVDLDLIDELYRRSYQEKVRGAERIRIHGASSLTGVTEHREGVDVRITDTATGRTSDFTADAVVYATGYDAPDPALLLGDAQALCLREPSGPLSVARDYRVRTTEELTAGIYLQGGTEHSHGITSSLLSLSAVRAGEIRDSLLDRRSGAPTSRPAALSPARA